VAALGTLAFAAGCAQSATPPASPATPESARSSPPVLADGQGIGASAGASTGPGARPSRDHARTEAGDLLVTADLELRDLRDMRARATDAAVAQSLDRQIESIARWRDAVMADRIAPQSSSSRARLEADTANLERAMAAGAAAEPQAPSPPPIERRDTTPGATEAFPPDR